MPLADVVKKARRDWRKASSEGCMGISRSLTSCEVSSMGRGIMAVSVVRAPTPGTRGELLRLIRFQEPHDLLQRNLRERGTSFHLKIRIVGLQNKRPQAFAIEAPDLGHA